MLIRLLFSRWRSVVMRRLTLVRSWSSVFIALVLLATCLSVGISLPLLRCLRGSRIALNEANSLCIGLIGLLLLRSLVMLCICLIRSSADWRLRVRWVRTLVLRVLTCWVVCGPSRLM